MYAKWIREPITGGVHMPSVRTTMKDVMNSCGFSWLGSNISEHKITGLNKKWRDLCNHFGIGDEVVGASFVDRVKKIQEKRGVEW
jgi:hypothetical protein